MSNWGWHTPSPAALNISSPFHADGSLRYVYENVSIDSADTRPGKGNRTVAYQFNCASYNDPKTCNYLHTFPARLNLGQLAFVLPGATPTEDAQQPAGPWHFLELRNITTATQRLDLWSGELQSSWSYRDAAAEHAVNVSTVVDRSTDTVATRVSAPSAMGLSVQLAFCTLSPGGYACDWSAPLEPHVTRVLRNSSAADGRAGLLDLHRVTYVTYVTARFASCAAERRLLRIV